MPWPLCLRNQSRLPLSSHFISVQVVTISIHHCLLWNTPSMRLWSWSHSSLYNSWRLAQRHVHEEPSVDVCVCVHMHVHSVAQSCLTLCYHMDHSLPGSSVMGFSQQEYWIGLPFSSPGHLSDPGTHTAWTAGGFFTLCTSWEAPLDVNKSVISLGQPMRRLQTHLHHRPGTHLDVVLEGGV